MYVYGHAPFWKHPGPSLGAPGSASIPCSVGFDASRVRKRGEEGPMSRQEAAKRPPRGRLDDPRDPKRRPREPKRLKKSPQRPKTHVKITVYLEDLLSGHLSDLVTHDRSQISPNNPTDRPEQSQSTQRCTPKGHKSDTTAA